MTKFSIRLVVVVRNFLLLARSRLRSLLRRITSGESEQAEERSKKGKVILFTQMEILMMAIGVRIRLMVGEHTVISTVIPMMVNG